MELSFEQVLAEVGRQLAGPHDGICGGWIPTVFYVMPVSACLSEGAKLRRVV